MRAAQTLLMVGFLLLSGCYRTVISTGARSDGQERRGGGLTVLYGLTPVNTGAVECPYGLARAETQFAWYSFFLMPLTAGLLAGMETKYECAMGPVDR